jgi:hypothetical protein
VICDFLGIEDLVLASLVLSLVDGLFLGRLQGNEMINIPEQCNLLGRILTAYLHKVS